MANDEVTEPQWSGEIKEPPKLDPEETTKPATRRRRSAASKSQGSSHNDADDPNSQTTGDSFPASDNDEEKIKPESQGLTILVTEAINLIASAATFVTRKRLGIRFQPLPSEARAMARPVSRIVSRKYKVKSDLNDAVDVVGAGAAMMNYFERITAQSLFSSDVSFDTTRSGRDEYENRTAQPPPRVSNEEALRRYATEQQNERGSAPAPAPAPSTAPPTSTAQAGKFEVGSGPVRQAFLAGYE